MRRLIILIVCVALFLVVGWFARGWFGDVHNLKYELEEAREINNFDKESSVAFKDIGGEFYKDTFVVTAYYPSPKQGGIYNAFGRRLSPGLSCSTDWNLIPPGSLVYVNGKVWYVDDNGTHVKGNEIDLCLPTKDDVDNWGSKRLDVWVYTPEIK